MNDKNLCAGYQYSDTGPYAVHCFEDNQIVLPVAVLEELDNLKKSEGEKGANARTAIRLLEGLRQKGDLLSGVMLERGGSLRVEKNFVDIVLPPDLPDDKMDNRILKVCRGLAGQQQDGRVILVTKDILLRIKAQIIGIQAEDFLTEQVSDKEEQYTGRIEVYAPEDCFKDFKKKGIPVNIVYTSSQEALMQSADRAPLVIVKGMAVTAKTFYSLAVGLEKLLNDPSGEYRKILISRPNAQFDSDIGFLPGDEQEKISPLMRPIIDNLEQLIDSCEEKRYENESELKGKIDEIFDRGLVQAEALNFIRGRSIVRTYLIIDEAQNMTPAQVKGIITRAGKGTKIILLGDPNQIDRSFLDEWTNGLSYAAEHMKGSSLCWQITLCAEECQRSQLAMDAVKRMQ